MATSAKQWRLAREEGIELLFPSNNEARVRPIEVDFFVRVGHVPDSLAPLIMKMINGENYLIEVPVVEQVSQSQEWLIFLNELVHYAFVEPQVVIGAPQNDDEISVDDVSYADKVYLYRFFSRPAHALRRFRDEQIKLVAAMATTANNGNSVQPDAENQSLGKSHNKVT